MLPSTLHLLTTLLPLLPLTHAHGRISLITTSTGTTYPGWDPDPDTGTPSKSPVPKLAAWSASNLGNIYIEPKYFNTSNITCHNAAKTGALHVVAEAGSTIALRWNEWPVSHKGPVLNYLAACPGTLDEGSDSSAKQQQQNGENGDCSLAKADALKFVKVEEVGLLNPVDPSGVSDAGWWGSDELISNNFTWAFTVPPKLKPGAYVLRHEIIALHVAFQEDGAQAYPQCVNLRVVPSTTSASAAAAASLGERAVAAGDDSWKDDETEPAPKFYGVRDAGILLDIHKKLSGYRVPGPQVWNKTASQRS